MRRAKILIKRWSILVHRWAGVAFCMLFLAWFLSGIVMMYWGYPSVSAVDRLAHAPALDPSQIRVSPEQAFALLHASERPTQARLGTFDGRPVYRFVMGRHEERVFADNGERQTRFSPEALARVASAWTALPASDAKVDVNSVEDQWTVPDSYRPLRPMLKYTWPNGEEVYVSEVTGEVAQHTTRATRMGAYFGAIPHWIYFTPVRKDQPLWSKVVIWLSGAGTVAVILGIVVGLMMYSPVRKVYRNKGTRSSIPYRGQKRWHTILGLSFGIVTCTWVFSGMMSMGPFWSSKDAATQRARVAQALRDEKLEISQFRSREPKAALEALRAGGKIKELELGMFGGQAVYIGHLQGGQTRVVPMSGPGAGEFAVSAIEAAARHALEPNQISEVRLVKEYEAYYIDRHGERPLPVLFIGVNDAAHSMYYIDPKTGCIVQSYDSEARVTRWLYHGLHSLDFPLLYRYRPLWDIVVLVLMTGGTALCITSLVIAYRLVRRRIQGRFSPKKDFTKRSASANAT